MHVYGNLFSSSLRKVSMLLEELGIGYGVTYVDVEDVPDDYATLNPSGRLPLLDEGDFQVPDATVIGRYLGAKFPDRLYEPTDAYERAHLIRLERICDADLQNMLNIWFTREVMDPLAGRERAEFTKEEEDNFRTRLGYILEYLDGILREQDFLLGDKMSRADIALASQLALYRLADTEIDPVYPGLRRFAKDMQARKSLAGLLDEELGYLAELRDGDDDEDGDEDGSDEAGHIDTANASDFRALDEEEAR